MSGPVRDLLLKRKTELLRQIISNSVDAKKGQGLVDELEDVYRHLQMEPEPIKGRYSACRRPIDAIAAYLRNEKQARSRKDIIRAVVEGGFGGGGPEQKAEVSRAIGVFLNGTGARTGVIREMNGLIGLGDWDDSRFV